MILLFKYKTSLSYLKIDCGAPSGITSGSVTSTGTTFGSTATYACNTGYSMTGSATITCQASSSWETAPTCTIKGKNVNQADKQH